jgi:hypothetical protein
MNVSYKTIINFLNPFLFKKTYQLKNKAVTAVEVFKLRKRFRKKLKIKTDNNTLTGNLCNLINLINAGFDNFNVNSSEGSL